MLPFTGHIQFKQIRRERKQTTGYQGIKDGEVGKWGMIT